MQVKVYNADGQETGTVELSSEIFEVQREKADAVVHQAAVTFLANRRQSVAHTKTRGEVRGGGKKPWRQKGTGRARAGSIRSPLWRGGGITFGPRPQRNFAKRMNKPAQRLAMRLALSDKAHNRKIHVLENFALPSGKTKDLIKRLQDFSQTLGLGKKILIVTSATDASLVKSSRNRPGVFVKTAHNLNIFDLLIASDILIASDALGVLENAYLKK